MGCYMNPEGMTKEEWLIAHGEATGRPAKFDERPGFLPVCLMRNPMFSAAGIAYTQGELRAFSEPDDLRRSGGTGYRWTT